jgi:hypothetical protein
MYESLGRPLQELTMATLLCADAFLGSVVKGVPPHSVSFSRRTLPRLPRSDDIMLS